MQLFNFKRLISELFNIVSKADIEQEEFEIEKNQRCLLLTAKMEDMLFSCGGLLSQKAKNFDVYCLTNGFKKINKKDLTYEEKVEARKKDFFDTMEKMNINYYHFFDDVDDNRIGLRLDKFKSIIFSDYDYIFIPNITEKNRDNRSISLILYELLKERPHKSSAKIVMYEITSPLAFANSYVDVESNIANKAALLQKLETEFAKTAISLNLYRGYTFDTKYAEAYCILDIDEFNKICKEYHKI